MPAPAAGGDASALTRSQRLFSGVVILLGVDVIWVASSEFTEYIFHDLAYDKPFFSTYFKTSLFTTYLLGFLVLKPWRDQCLGMLRGEDGVARRRLRQRYQRVNESEEEAADAEMDAGGQDDDVEEGEEVLEVDGAVGGGGGAGDFVPRVGLTRSLSSPTWVPANIPESGKSSGTESEGELGGGASSRARRVRFKNVAQVVEMNPSDALYANLARLSYNASLRAQAALRRAASRLTIGEVMRLALLFCVPWFLGNFCYQTALSDTEAAVVNVLSSSSCLFTLVLAAVFPSESGDRITLSKLVAVCFSVLGVVLISYSDLEIEGGGGVPKGALWTLAGSFFYSTYIVLLRRKVSHEDNMDSPMFFGFVGLFNTVLLWPGLVLLSLTHREDFELPTGKQLQYLVVNGMVGTVLSELLWLWGCFYTSSLIATLSLSLTIPMSILADILWKGKGYGPTFLAGAAPMFFSFFVVAMLTHYEDWDPALDLLKSVWSRFKGFFVRGQGGGAGRAYVFDRHERESLIQQNNHHQDAALSSHDEI